MQGLSIEAVEWLPSGAESGLVRVRGRWTSSVAVPVDSVPPALLVRSGGADHRFDSLPDARFAREPASWRGSYLVPAALVTVEPDAMWIEWPDGTRAGLPAMTRGIEPPPAEAPEKPIPPTTVAGAQVIDRAVLAERRARRAEAAERAQAKIAAEALKAVEALELRSAELERRLAEAAPPVAAPEPGAAPVAPPEPGAAAPGAAAEAALTEAARLRVQLLESRRRLRLAETARVEAASAAAAGERAREAAVASARVDAERRAAGLQAIHAEVRAELERRIADAHTAAAALRHEVAELRVRLEHAEVSARTAAEQIAAAQAEARAASERVAHAEAAAELADGRLQTESTARAALEDELDRERQALAARESADATLATLRGELAAATTGREEAAAALATTQLELEDARAAAAELATTQAAHAASRAELDAARADAAAARAEVASVRVALDDLRADLEAERAARRSAEAAHAESEQAGASLQDRIAELERRAAEAPDPDRLERLAREQAQAAAARPANGEGADLAARLDAAAAALRTRTPAPPPPPPTTAESEPPPAEPAAVEAGEAEPAAPDEDGAAAGGEVAPDGTAGAGPVLRRGIVRLARDDPGAAARVLVDLLPAQGAFVDGPLSYDLTIRELGTVTVDVASGAVRTTRSVKPRGRRRAAFHVTADALTLAELLTGVEHRVGRFRGPVRVRGRRRQERPLREAIVAADLGVVGAVRSGARIEPGLAWRVLAYAVEPAWTRGLSFTVASTVGPNGTWYLTARNGGGLAAAKAAPRDPDATVRMSRAAFDRLLRDEPHPHGDRPTIRGDHAAVAALLALAQRVRG